jgi:hypothetical protein
VALASFVANGLSPLQGRGPYTFRLHGQVYHKVGTLHPTEGQLPRYGQLYIIEGDQAIEHRLADRRNQNCRREVLTLLTVVLECVNPFVGAYKHMYEVEQEQQTIAEDLGIEPPEVTMFIKRGHDQRRYNEPRHDEVAAVFTSNDGAPPANPDIAIHPRNAAPVNLHYLSANADPMTYPVFFPHGEYGWHLNMPYNPEHARGARQTVTCLQFYAYRLAMRQTFSAIFYGSKLFQQYVVDSYLKVESNNLNYIRQNQTQLRVDSYQGLMDHINTRAENENKEPGKMVILPSSFKGSPRSMQQHYQDAMSIVRKYGKPDLFLTFTCNPRHKDIVENLLPGQTAADRPDIVSRVFKLHLGELLKDIKKRNVLGVLIAHIYVIEYQKRGLPHAHLLLIFDDGSKLREPDDIDSLISAEIPDNEVHPNLYQVVKTCMVHGPSDISTSSLHAWMETSAPKTFQSHSRLGLSWLLMAIHSISAVRIAAPLKSECTRALLSWTTDRLFRTIRTSVRSILLTLILRHVLLSKVSNTSLSMYIRGMIVQILRSQKLLLSTMMKSSLSLMPGTSVHLKLIGGVLSLKCKISPTP